MQRIMSTHTLHVPMTQLKFDDFIVGDANLAKVQYTHHDENGRPLFLNFIGDTALPDYSIGLTNAKKWIVLTEYKQLIKIKHYA